MRENANTTITGERVVLVPYRRHHVAAYHAWMQDPRLQEATASEPLSLEEEYAMQRRWRDDADKLTFILLDRARPDTPGTGAHGGGMCGDVNLFFNDHDDARAAEVEVMVAEPASRRHGLAREALSLLMAYAAARLQVTLFRAKIGEANTASLALFGDSGGGGGGLGFKEVSRSQVFKEVTLELRVKGEAKARLEAAAAALAIGAYDGDDGGEDSGDEAVEGEEDKAGRG